MNDPATLRDWAERNRRAYKRIWARQQRATRRLIGSLHDLGCEGPTRASGCRCRKIPVYAA